MYKINLGPNELMTKDVLYGVELTPFMPFFFIQFRNELHNLWSLLELNMLMESS